MGSFTELIIILSPFEKATCYLNEKKYITYSIMAPIIKQIKNLLLFSNSLSNLSIITSPVFNTPEIFQEMKNADDVFIVIEEVEIQENENIVNRNNNQTENKIDLNKPLETEDILNEVKKNLYNSMCYYWECTTDDNLLSTILDPRVKSMGNK